MGREFREELDKRLQDEEFTKSFGAASAKSDFALTLSEARNNRNVTQKQLADKLGTSQSYIAKLEGGEANPTIGAIGKILALLGFRLSTRAVPLESSAYSVHRPNQALDSMSLLDSSYVIIRPQVEAEVKTGSNSPLYTEVYVS